MSQTMQPMTWDQIYAAWSEKKWEINDRQEFLLDHDPIIGEVSKLDIKVNKKVHGTGKYFGFRRSGRSIQVYRYE